MPCCIRAIGHAFAVAQQSKLTRKELEVLEKREMFLHDSRNAILYAEQKGQREGKEEGQQEGMEIGEKQAAMKIARQLLDVLDVETISAKTGLSLTEIQELRSLQA